MAVHLHEDVDYLALVRDLATLTTNVSQGSGATVCAVLRVSADRIWVGITPHNQLAWRYALQVPVPEHSQGPIGVHGVVRIMRRSESIRKHHGSRFESLEEVGRLHGVPVYDSSAFINDPPLDIIPDSIREIVFAAAGQPAPLPAENETRLAGFCWFDPEYVRIYVVRPGESGVIGLDIDYTEASASVTEMMSALSVGVPESWASNRQAVPDLFCESLFSFVK